MVSEIQGGGSNELSTDINTITAEINAYQRVAGEAIFEIGRRLKHVKENDLAHGEFGDWVESVGINRYEASRFIRVYDELGGSKLSTYANFGLNALNLIATLPPAERKAEHTTAKGETKTPSEMTVRELRELKAELRKAQEQRNVEQKERERLEKENEELANQPIKVETKTEYVEIDNTPEDYETIKREKEELAKRLAEIPKTKELRDRTFDTPHGVKLLDDYYNAMDELSEWQRKYAWITSDIEQLRTISQVDEDMQEEFRKNMNMWRTLSEIFYGRDDDIVDAEIININ